MHELFLVPPRDRRNEARKWASQTNSRSMLKHTVDSSHNTLNLLNQITREILLGQQIHWFRNLFCWTNVLRKSFVWCLTRFPEWSVNWFRTLVQQKNCWIQHLVELNFLAFVHCFRSVINQMMIQSLHLQQQHFSWRCSVRDNTTTHRKGKILAIHAAQAVGFSLSSCHEMSIIRARQRKPTKRTEQQQEWMATLSLCRHWLQLPVDSTTICQPTCTSWINMPDPRKANGNKSLWSEPKLKRGSSEQ